MRKQYAQPACCFFYRIQKGCPGKNSPLNYAYEKRPFRARFTNVVSPLPTHGNRHGDIVTIQAAIQGNETEP